MSENQDKKKAGFLAFFAGLPMKIKAIISAVVIAAIAGAVAISGIFSGSPAVPTAETTLIDAFWPSVFAEEENTEPEFIDDENRTNNAFNVMDFGEQGTNGWFYRYGKTKTPWKAARATMFDGEKYSQPGANGLEIKKNFVHTSEAASPILEWKVAENGKVNVRVTYVKNVNGDNNPSYPDGVQLLVYKDEELLAFENVDISITDENLCEITLEDVEVNDDESFYFVVDKRANNAFDGGSLYIAINDVNAEGPSLSGLTSRSNNNANNQKDFGEQGTNGWCYMYGKTVEDLELVSNMSEGEYFNSTSPNLAFSQGFIHPSINHNAALGWIPAVNGSVDLRVKYTKFEQNDGNPDFPDGVKIKVYKNSELLYEEHVDAPSEGENKIAHRIQKLDVTTNDRLYFMVDAESNASYDGGAFDITIIDVNGRGNESSVKVDETSETRQNFANVKYDFGQQGNNGWIYQFGYEDEPMTAYNSNGFSEQDDRYFEDSWLEIKRDYVNPGENGRSAIIKWKVAQNGKIAVDASYTKMKNEDKNPSWPDGTRVSIYHNNSLLKQETFAPETGREVTKRLDVSSVSVKKGDYITMVINGLENNAYDGGQYEFAIRSLSGLVGPNEKTVKATYDGKRTNTASVIYDFGKQGYNGWYYQYGYGHDPFCAVNITKCENNEKYYTNDGVEIKKDYIVPSTNGKSAIVKWIAAESGKINIDLEYTKLLNEDKNPDWPDGVTVYLMHNKSILKKEYFAPLTKKEVTKSLAFDGLNVKAGDAITMIVDPGENGAYDGGKYMFVIEDASKIPTIKAGNYDNSTSLGTLSSMKQGTDGWWFLEGKSISDAKILTKMNADQTAYTSLRTEGLEVQKSFVHTGATRDPMYLWVVGQNGNIDIEGEYVKFGQEDQNPDWPDGVTVKIFKNNNEIYSKKVKAKRGDGNNNTISFNFRKLAVKRGDKIWFMISADKNWAWDGGCLRVAIDPTNETVRTPGDDNNTSLAGLTSIKQGTDGWWFLEGTTVANATELTKMNDDGTAYLSVKTEALEMKKDYVHTGATKDPIYQWIVKDNGEVDIAGSYTKFGQDDANPSYPDGVTLKIYQNNTLLLSRKVNVLKGDGNNNSVSFNFNKLSVKSGDAISFQISADDNYAWDAGSLSVAIEEYEEIIRNPGDDNNSELAKIANVEQGTDGWYFLEGTNLKDAKLLTNINSDKSAYTSVKTSGLEVKKDYVHTGATLNPIYQWVVKDAGKLSFRGSYTKFGHNDGNPSWPDGVTLSIYQNDTLLRTEKVNVKQGDGNDNVVEFAWDDLDVSANDIFSFMISADNNNAWDAGRLAVVFGEEQNETDEDYEPDPNRTNNADLVTDFSGTQGTNGWFYGQCEWNGVNFEKIAYDADNNRYYNNGKPELKSDYVEPGNGKNAAYKWIAAKDGTIYVKGEYVKFANADDANADGTCVRIFVAGEEKKWMGTIGNYATEQTVTFNEIYTVKEGQALIFAVNPEGNDSYDGGKLTVTISDTPQTEPETPEEPEDPTRTNNTVLKDDFSGTQGANGWYYGACDWDSKNFTELTYDADNNRYFNDGKPELKADFVEPGNGRNAAYKWVVAEDGTVTVSGTYAKFANADDANADGTCVRIFLNGEEKKWLGTLGNFSEEQTVTFSEEYEVRKGDEIVFAVNPEGNDAWDGGRLEVTISEKKTEPETPEEPSRTNNTVLKDDFSGTQGANGWYYGACDWDSKNFTELTYDADNNRYFNDGKPELKADFVEPGNGRNAAYKWVVAEDGTVTVSGTYAKFANADDSAADGTCVRIFLNGEEKKWLGTLGNFSEEQTVTFSEEYEVRKGDEIVFAVNPEGNDAWDGGRLEVTISEKKTEPETPEEPEEPSRTNNTVLKDDFSGTQGANGWYYGECDWDSKNFAEIAFDADNNRYYKSGKPELKADFVEPGNGRNAAYKWVAAEDGKVYVTGEYVKFANADDSSADGTCVRIFLNGDEKKWLGCIGNYADEQKVTFSEEYDVKAGDEIIFAINPEGNDAWDGGRLEVTISDQKPEEVETASKPSAQDVKKPAEEEKPAETPVEEKKEEEAEEVAEEILEKEEETSEAEEVTTAEEIEETEDSESE